MKNHIQLDIQDNEAILSYLSDKIILPIGIKNFNGFTFQHSPITAYEFIHRVGRSMPFSYRVCAIQYFNWVHSWVHPKR